MSQNSEKEIPVFEMTELIKSFVIVEYEEITIRQDESLQKDYDGTKERYIQLLEKYSSFDHGRLSPSQQKELSDLKSHIFSIKNQIYQKSKQKQYYENNQYSVINEIISYVLEGFDDIVDDKQTLHKYLIEAADVFFENSVEYKEFIKDDHHEWDELIADHVLYMGEKDDSSEENDEDVQRYYSDRKENRKVRIKADCDENEREIIINQYYMNVDEKMRQYYPPHTIKEILIVNSYDEIRELFSDDRAIYTYMSLSDESEIRKKLKKKESVLYGYNEIFEIDPSNIYRLPEMYRTDDNRLKTYLLINNIDMWLLHIDSPIIDIDNDEFDPETEPEQNEPVYTEEKQTRADDYLFAALDETDQMSVTEDSLNYIDGYSRAFRELMDSRENVRDADSSVSDSSEKFSEESEYMQDSAELQGHADVSSGSGEHTFQDSLDGEEKDSGSGYMEYQITEDMISYDDSADEHGNPDELEHSDEYIQDIPDKALKASEDRENTENTENSDSTENKALSEHEELSDEFENASDYDSYEDIFMDSESDYDSVIDDYISYDDFDMSGSESDDFDDFFYEENQDVSNVKDQEIYTGQTEAIYIDDKIICHITPSMYYIQLDDDLTEVLGIKAYDMKFRDNRRFIEVKDHYYHLYKTVTKDRKIVFSLTRETVSEEKLREIYDIICI